MSGLIKDPTDYSYKREPEDNLVYGFKKTKHSSSSIELYKHTESGSVVPGHKLPKLSFTGLSPTLRAGSESERGSHTAPRPVHPIDPRCITVREAARLHGYPDWFAFYPVIHHGFRQVGNSVSPLVARNVGEKIIQALNISQSKLVPKKTIQLKNEFNLVEDRKKSEKRISHLSEFPKVINYLFEQAFNHQTSKLSKPKFSHQDIEYAFKETKANTPRIKPDSFLSEFSKTRNAREILALPISFGFSILQTESGGEFVKASVVGAIGTSINSSFSSKDVKTALTEHGIKNPKDIFSHSSLRVSEFLCKRS